MDPKYQTLPFNTKFGSKQHKIANHSTEVNNSNNKSEFDSVNMNGMLQYNSNNNSASVSGSFSTNGVSKISATKNPLLEERPSPSGSSCSSEHASLTYQTYNNQYNHIDHLVNNQNSIINSINSPCKPIPLNISNGNASSNELLYLQQKQYQNHFIQQQQKMILKELQQQLEQKKLQQQQFQEELQQQGVSCMNTVTNDVKTTSTTTSLIKPQFNNQICCYQNVNNEFKSIQNNNNSTSTTISSNVQCSVPNGINTLHNISTHNTSNDNDNHDCEPDHVMMMMMNSNTKQLKQPSNKTGPSVPPKPTVQVPVTASTSAVQMPPPRQTLSIESVDNAILKQTNITNSQSQNQNQIQNQSQSQDKNDRIIINDTTTNCCNGYGLSTESQTENSNQR